MTAVRSQAAQDDFSAGMVRDVAPALIPPNGAYDLVDALLDEDGNPYRRGGTSYKSNAGLGESGLTWIWDGYLKPGARTVFANSSDFGVLASDDVTPINLGGAGMTLPKQSAVLEDLLFIGGGTIYGGSRKTAVYSTKTVKVTKGSKVVTGKETAFSTNVDVGMLFHVTGGSERVYIVAEVKSDTELILRDNYTGESGEGKNYTLNPIWTVGGDDPYEVFDYLAVCANRLVGISGRTIRYSEVDDPHTYVSGLGTPDEHTIQEGAEGKGVATVGLNALIFTTGGIQVLEGLALDIVDQNGNPQHRLQLLSSEAVLADAPGMAGAGQQLLVPTQDGIYLMDGISQPVRVSRPVTRLYRKRMDSGYRLGRAVVYRGHYFLPVIDPSSGDVRDLFVCRLDRPVRSRSQDGFPWSRFTGDGGEITAFAVRTRIGPTEPKLLGAQARTPSRVVLCSSYFDPGAEVKNDADGTTHDFDLITRDIPTGGDTENEIRNLMLRYELVDAGGDGPVLKVYWSSGALTGGEAEWDEVSWDEFDWAADEASAVFNAIAKDGPVSTGQKRQRFRVNKKLPYGRFRIKTSNPVATFTLRALEMNVRPSGATRR